MASLRRPCIRCSAGCQIVSPPLLQPHNEHSNGIDDVLDPCLGGFMAHTAAGMTDAGDTGADEQAHGVG